MIYDKDFLSQLSKVKHKTVYARITALTFDERPMQRVEGRITQGSVNIDGASAIRRTCSLTIVAQNFKYDDYYWGLNTKFKLEVGLENVINSTYPEIIWFNQGIYLITTFNTSRTTNNFTIQISGKDKMALLNGEISGSIEARTDFGTIEEENADGVWSYRKIPIYDIIKNMIHVYAREPYENIIINDLDIYGLELLEYRQDKPLYVFQEINNLHLYSNATTDEDKACKVYLPSNDGKPSTLYKVCTLKDLDELDLKPLMNLADKQTYPKIIELFDDKDIASGKYFYVAKIEYGQTAGYKETELVYPGDLIANIGESVTSILDKIKNTLGYYEYFYNVDGQFVFQKKKEYVDMDWSPIVQSNGETYVAAESEEYAYLFNDLGTITSFSKNPNLLNLKNDYSVWGQKTSASGQQVPIHIRYAIDKKPSQYTLIKVSEEEVRPYNEKYGTTLKKQVHYTYTTDKYDWREIIYQMAKDYLAYGHLDDFELKIVEANGDLYPGGRTGYEAYYTDLLGFWRDLYNPDIEVNVIRTKIMIKNKEKEASKEKDPTVVLKLTRQIEDLYLKLNNILEDAKNFYYYTYDENGNPIYEITNRGLAYDSDGDLVIDSEEQNDFALRQVYMYGETPKLLGKVPAYDEIIITEVDGRVEGTNIKDKVWDSSKDDNSYPDKDYQHDNEVYFKYIKTHFVDSNLYWNRAVFNSPWTINFWFDFLDPGGEMECFSVPMIGNRAKVVNDNNVKAIYFRETPEIIYKPMTADDSENEDNSKQEEQDGYTYLQAPEEYFSISAQGRSAKDKLNELIYQHSYCIESSTITTIPIYYLQPNSKVHLFDEALGLNGDYIVSKITVPLTYNGTMQLTAVKTTQRIL